MARPLFPFSLVVLTVAADNPQIPLFVDYAFAPAVIVCSYLSLIPTTRRRKLEVRIRSWCRHDTLIYPSSLSLS
ncbi:hypothetical protein B0H19DRAFT_1132485 [Mycena capillaripes]|nr:hypothetical protein B0H19DRAFT_1132485 [Mycena capillaripes]